jgi:hypothetical protein
MAFQIVNESTLSAIVQNVASMVAFPVPSDPAGSEDPAVQQFVQAANRVNQHLHSLRALERRIVQCVSVVAQDVVHRCHVVAHALQCGARGFVGFCEPHNLLHFWGCYEIPYNKHIGVMNVFDDHIVFLKESSHYITVFKPWISSIKSNVFYTYLRHYNTIIRIVFLYYLCRLYRERMKLFTYLILTFIVAFFVQFWVLSIISVSSTEHVKATRGKAYLSVVAASIMCILEVFIYDWYKNETSLFYYISFVLVAYLFSYLFKNQVGVDDQDYLKQMLEAHSRDLLLSKQMLQTTKSQSIQTVATNYINRRNKDIDVVKKLIDDKDKNDKAKIPVKSTMRFGTVSPQRVDPPVRNINTM